MPILSQKLCPTTYHACPLNPGNWEDNCWVIFISLMYVLLMCDFLTLYSSQLWAPDSCPFQNSLFLWSLASLSLPHALWRRDGQNFLFLLNEDLVQILLVPLSYVHLIINNPLLLSIMTLSFTVTSVSWWNSEWYIHFCLLHRIVLMNTGMSSGNP